MNEGLGLRQCRDEKRSRIFEEGLRRKVQSRTGQGDNVKIRASQGERITEKHHHQRGEIRDLLNPCKGENDNQSQGQADFATIRLIHRPREDARKVLHQLAVITTCRSGPTITATGSVPTLEIDDLHQSTEPSRHVGHHQLAQDQAQEVSHHQLTHTSRDETDVIRRTRLPAQTERDPGRHRTRGLVLRHHVKNWPNKAGRLHENSLHIPPDYKRRRNYRYVSPIEKSQITSQLQDAAAALPRDTVTIVTETIPTRWQVIITIMAYTTICIEGIRGLG